MNGCKNDLCAPLHELRGYGIQYIKIIKVDLASPGRTCHSYPEQKPHKHMRNTGPEQSYSNLKIFAYQYSQLEDKTSFLVTERYMRAIKLLCGVSIVNKCRFVHVVVWHIMTSPQTLNHITKLEEKSTLLRMYLVLLGTCFDGQGCIRSINMCQL